MTLLVVASVNACLILQKKYTSLPIRSVGFWFVRGVGIIADDHTLGFTVVHTVLMVVSIGLAGWAWVVRPVGPGPAG